MIRVIDNPISKQELHDFLGNPFPDMIKFVVDVKREKAALGGELHSDGEAALLETGSSQSDLWGGNFYPGNPKGEQAEYSSLINIRPSMGNNSLEVRDEALKARMKVVLGKLLP